MSAAAIFRRATKGVLSILGEDSFLHGAACGKVNIEFGVQVTGPTNDSTFVRDVATIDSTYAPSVGNVLLHPTYGTFKLDSKLDDTGFYRRFVILKVTNYVPPDLQAETLPQF